MAMVFKDYYKILGFETNKISIDDIKNAYREKAKKYHPDVNITNQKFRREYLKILMKHIEYCQMKS